MKLLGGKMKKVYSVMALQMYCCYLAGRQNEKDGIKEMTLKEFSKNAEAIHKLGQEIYKENVKNGAKQPEGPTA